jgi:hypothetical protein
MFSRKEVRHTCYLMQKGAAVSEKRKWLIPEVEKVMLPEDSWEDFANTWDVFVTKNNIVRIVPETDQTFIHSTVIEIKTKVEMGIDIEEILDGLPPRKRNVYHMVDLNYLGDEIDWGAYEESWKIQINYGSKRIEVVNLNTQINKPRMPEPKTTLAEAVKQEVTLDAVDQIDDDLKSKLMALLGK